MKSHAKIYLSITLVIAHQESNENKCLTLVSANERKDILKKMKNYGVYSEILLHQQAITQMIMLKNKWKSNLIMMAIYLGKHWNFVSW